MFRAKLPPLARKSGPSQALEGDRKTLKRQNTKTVPHTHGDDETLWETLNPHVTKRGAKEPESYLEMKKDDQNRKMLLRLSNETSPINTVSRIDMLHRTVVPTLLKEPVQWFGKLHTLAHPDCGHGHMPLQLTSGCGTHLCEQSWGFTSSRR